MRIDLPKNNASGVNIMSLEINAMRGGSILIFECIHGGDVNMGFGSEHLLTIHALTIAFASTICTFGGRPRPCRRCFATLAITFGILALSFARGLGLGSVARTLSVQDELGFLALDELANLVQVPGPVYRLGNVPFVIAQPVPILSSIMHLDGLFRDLFVEFPLDFETHTL